MLYKGVKYTEVKDRVHEFRTNPKYEDWSIITELVWHLENMSAVVFKATIRGPVVESKNWVQPQVFTGFAYEEKVTTGSDFDVNRDAWVENCETSAVGRAFANMDIGVHTSEGIVRPSAEEMSKVTKMSDSRKAEPTKKFSKPEAKPDTKNETGNKFVDIIDPIGKELNEIAGHPFYEKILEREGKFKSASEIKTRMTQEDTYKNVKGALELVKSLLKPYCIDSGGGNMVQITKISQLEQADRDKIFNQIDLITGI